MTVRVVPIVDIPDHVSAAEAATRERNAGFMTVMLEGRYTDAYLEDAGGETPTFTDEELKTISPHWIRGSSDLSMGEVAAGRAC